MNENLTSTPFISVLMPVYNTELYLKEAIQSILNQTYKNFEFIIINDGSTDNSENIILSFDDKRIKYIKNEKNLQIVKTLNKGISLSKGKYIARMDADDISLSNRLEKQLTFMKKNNIDICGSWTKLFGYKDEVWKFPINHEEIKVNLMFNSCIVHPSVMIKKEVFMKVSYQEKYNKAEDYALWVLTIDQFKLGNIPEVLIKYRIHENQTEKTIQLEKANIIKKIILKKNFNNLNDDDIEKFIKLTNNEMLEFNDLFNLLNNIIKINKSIQYMNEEILLSVLSKKVLIFLSINSNNLLDDFLKLRKMSLGRTLKIPLSLYFIQYIKHLIGFYK